MSKPQFAAYSKTVFVVEGNRTALVITRRGNKCTGRAKQFASPAAALEWCRTHRAGMVYQPEGFDPSRN